MILRHTNHLFLIPILTIISLSQFSHTCLAQFGLFDQRTTAATAGDREERRNNHPSNTHNNVNNDDAIILKSNDLLLEDNDPELLEAFQIFAEMSPQELMETTLELRDMFSNDPQALEEVEQVMKEIYKINRNMAAEKTVEDQEHPDLFSMIMSDTLEMLRNAKEEDWALVLEHKDAILKAVILSGFMAEEEAEVYRKDAGAWEEQLMIIWEELKKQASLEEY
jgi:propanediol dehydratase small subunit